MSQRAPEVPVAVLANTGITAGIRTAVMPPAVATGAWRVLVVESDVQYAESLIHGLRRHGHEVDVVECGGMALQVYGHADLVLIDLELPDLDGLEVCRAISSRNPYGLTM